MELNESSKLESESVDCSERFGSCGIGGLKLSSKRLLVGLFRSLRVGDGEASSRSRKS